MAAVPKARADAELARLLAKANQAEMPFERTPQLKRANANAYTKKKKSKVTDDLEKQIVQNCDSDADTETEGITEWERLEEEAKEADEARRADRKAWKARKVRKKSFDENMACMEEGLDEQDLNQLAEVSLSENEKENEEEPGSDWEHWMPEGFKKKDLIARLGENRYCTGCGLDSYSGPQCKCMQFAEAFGDSVDIEPLCCSNCGFFCRSCICSVMQSLGFKVTCNE
jgi:hypothetical protein